jgi:hypothetical protein
MLGTTEQRVNGLVGCAHTATSCLTFSGALRAEFPFATSLQPDRIAASKGAYSILHSAFGGGGCPKLGAP